MNNGFQRRVFLRSAATGALAFCSSRLQSSSSGESRPRSYSEPPRQVPIMEHADVLVAGGGPAGIAAAVGAARAGAKTRLIESQGCLGGTWTAGLLSWILDSGNKKGLVQEIIKKLESRGAAARYGSSVGYAVEAMKLLLDEMCLEAGVKVQLYTRVAEAARDSSGRLSLAITESKSGRQAWSAESFIDATGDGDLACRAGCRYDYGRPGTGAAQPMSLMALLTGIDPEEVAVFVRGLAEPRGERDPKRRLKAEMERAGISPSYSRPTLFFIREGLFCLAANHQYGCSGTDAAHLTRATILARSEVNHLVDALRSLGGAWRNVQIVATSEHIGVREGRRIHGLYQVTRKDLISGARHADGICRVTFPVDVHSTDPRKEKGILREGVRARPYDIPFRALISRDVDGLLMAGRCISGDFVAHSSYRVTGNAVAMGQAAGTAAALAARSGRLPREVSWQEIRKELKKHGTPLDE